MHSALETYQEDENSPGANRVRYNSFIFNCALLAEGELLVQRMHKHFGTRPDFRKMVQILNAASARDLLQRNLRPLRNSLAFHFDEDEVATQLKDLDLDQPIYISGLGDANRQTHHELADVCAAKSFAGPAFSNSGDTERLVHITTEVTSAFLDAAETFISAVLFETGWKFVQYPDPTA